MSAHDVVLDTNVLISGLRSRRGASFRLLSVLGTAVDIRTHVSVPLVLEYEQVAKRQAGDLGLTARDIDNVLDYLCHVSIAHDIYYLWRPVLRDPRDDMVLEVAVAGECEAIVTYNTADFEAAAQFGIEAITPRALLKKTGDL